MNYNPPFPVPESRKNDETFQSRVARLNKIREEAKARLAERYANINYNQGKWLTDDDMLPQLERPQIL